LSEPDGRAGFAPALGLTATLACGAMLGLIAAALLVKHPFLRGLGAYVGYVNQQDQPAKTWLYLAAFLVVLPGALVLGPALADRIARGPNASGLPALVAVLAGALALALVLVRCSSGLPWGSGLGPLLVAALAWAAVAVASLARAARARAWPPLLALARGPLAARALWSLAGALAFATLLCVTDLRALSVRALVAAAALALAGIGALERVRPAAPRGAGVVVDVAVVAGLALAIPNVVVFHATGGLPSPFYPPGVIQFQQDWMLGPVNQLLGGGALLVRDPVSQYGVGSLYFIAGWFKLAPIGYGTFGLLDGLLTALLYIAGYGVLRLAGSGRVLAVGAIAFAVLALPYHFYYAVGELPEQGPLRFGLPMVVVVAGVVRARAGGRAPGAEAAILGALGIAAVWALETFGYTLATFLALSAFEAWQAGAAARWAWLRRRLGRGLLACVAAQLAFAAATLLASGSLPDWGEYLAYITAFVSGAAGAVSYGFASWSPGLAVGAADLISAAAVVLVIVRAPRVAQRERVLVSALVGLTTYAIALYSYSDNRSSTYVFPYVALPILLAGALWLALLLRCRQEMTAALRRAGVVAAACVAVLMLGAAWPSVPSSFELSALRHALPGGGGLGHALHRLWHPPAIDPRAPAGERLLARYVPGRRVLVLLPDAPDLGTEILIRARRYNSMFIGDPKADSLVPSVWLPRLRRDVAALAPGTRLLTDAAGLRIAARLRAHPRVDVIDSPIDGGYADLEWLLRAIDERFAIRPIARARDGLIVAQLAPR
jgi:hypothetical protein